MLIKDIKEKYKKIVIWAGGADFQNLRKTCPELLSVVDYVVDRNSALWEQELRGGGIKVKSVELLKTETDKVLIIISTNTDKYVNEIMEEIEGLNIDADIVTATDLVSEPQNLMDFRSTSQFGEDIIIAKLLVSMNIQTISYIEIGVPHPVYASNTYYFYQHGSRGICVEPNPDVIRRIKGVRQEDVVINKGIGAAEDSGKQLKYYRFKGSKALNTFSETIVENREKAGVPVEDVIEIPIISLNQVLAEYCVKCPDYISIDVEGYEYRILKDFDFSAYPVSIICVEKNADMEKIIDIMKDNDYRIFAETFANLIFVLNQFYALFQESL